MKPLPSNFFKTNRRRLLEKAGADLLVIAGAGLMQRSSDVAYPFHQDSSFYYLAGLNEPNLTLVIDGKRGDEFVITASSNDYLDVFYDAANTASFSKTSGVKIVLDHDAGWRELKDRLKNVRRVGIVEPPTRFVEFFGLYTQPARAALKQRLKVAKPKLTFSDLRPVLTELRAVKHQEEIKQIQTAIDITVNTLNELKPQMGEYQTEAELEADITRGFRRRGADGHGYTPIVASGANAITVHYDKNCDKIAKNSFTLLDVGAEVNHYSADITHSYPVGKITTRQRAVFDAVREVQAFALQELKPGVLQREYERAVEKRMGEELLALGLIKTNESKAVRRYFPYATSHHLGLDVHDVFDVERPLEAGMVLTVEPGIHIKEEGLGIRLEDDVVVTPTGVNVLSKKLKRDLD